jgi:ABC-type polysaccharide/polyol phosphate transport system ATPase subunit
MTGPKSTAHGGPAVAVDHISKQFRVPKERYYTLKERALHGFRRTRWEMLEGLHDVSFTVAPGEFFGVVGRNGSGKSTLLKCVAGIYRTDEGKIAVSGRVSTFIELGVGFNMDLAAEDNVVLNAILLGLEPHVARERVDEVIAFAGLEEFRDLKLKNYSSGMYVRLAFSVMIHVDADVLLIDEVLAVGDAAFQHKCYAEFERLRDEGRTIVFVTHDMHAVNRFCHRALLLERGRVIAIGDPKHVTGQYMAVNFREERGLDAVELIGKLDDRAAYVADAWLENEHGRRCEYIAPGDSVTCKVQVNFNWALEDPALVLVIETAAGATAFATSSAWTGRKSGRFEPGECAVFAVTFETQLAAGRYYVSPQVALLEGENAGVVDRRDRAAAFVVTAAGAHDLRAAAAHEFTIERRRVRELST